MNSVADHHEDVWTDWRNLVNMSAAAMERWLATFESQSVGVDSGDGESVGHKSGARIARIQRMRRDELSEDDWAHMARVVGFIRRHLAQGGPAKDVEESRWRYSLMNWGHDPLKD